MIEDIDYLGDEWGRRMRGSPYGWYRENHINRLYEDEFIGSGNSFKLKAVTSDNLDTFEQNSYQSGRRDNFRIAASGANAATYGALGRNPAYGLKKNYQFYRPKAPIGFMSEDQLRFHRANSRLKECYQEMLWAHFVPKVNHKRKLDLLKTTKAEYDKRLDLSLKAVTREIDRIDAKPTPNREAAPKHISERVVGPLWSCRIFSYVHKVAINDQRRNPWPICLSLTGHYNPQSPFVEGPIDPNVYCLRQDGELYAVVPNWEWLRLRRQGQLDNHMTDLRGSQGRLTRITQESKPIRILRQTRKGQWLVGEDDNLKHIRKLKGLEHIAIAWQSSEVDALKAIWGLDNDAHLPAYSSEDSFGQKAMRGFQTPEVKILGIQSPEVQLQIKQRLSEFEEKISEADEQGLTDLCKQYKKDMADFKRLTKGSCISKKWSRPADDGDIFRPILHNLRERRTSAMDVLRKNGLHDEADDLENCYKIENRTAIFFASRSRFTWVFSRD